MKGYDYTGDGAYFITICTHWRIHVFGTIVNGEMRFNEYGREVANCWLWLAERYPYVHLDEWVVMPDHMHAIVVITDDHRAGTGSNVPCSYGVFPPPPYYGYRGSTGRWCGWRGDRTDETQTIGAFDRGVQNRLHQTCERHQIHPRREIVAT
jgi:hypothetical protein